MKLAERMSRIGVESAFEVLVRARALEAQGRDIIHLEIGEPDFPTPRHIVEAAKQALDEGWTHYGPTQGLPELREAIAAYISRTRGIHVGPEHVCVVPGGKPIIFFPMMALLEPGDEVIYPNPGFPIYESMINFLGAKPVPMPLVEERGFSFDLDLLARQPVAERTKMVILNSPQNPTGGVIPAEDMRAIAEMVRDRDLMVLSRRDLLAHLLRAKPPLSIATLAGHAGEDHHPGRLLEDLRDDRLAHGLRRDADVAGGRGEQADGEFELLHGQLHAARRHRRAERSAGRRGRDGGRVPPPPRRVLCGAERDSRIPLRDSGRRVLRVSQRHGHWHRPPKELADAPAARSRRGVPERHRVRRVRRRLYPVQLRQFV